MKCPDADLLADYTDGVCDLAQRAEVERHLVACDTCRQEVAAQRELLHRLRAVPVDNGRHASLVAGLMELHRSEPVHPRVARRGPGTLAACAPPQYVSARRSVACALFAAVGCVGVALVAAHVPGDDRWQDSGGVGTVQHVSDLSARTNGDAGAGARSQHRLSPRVIAQVVMVADPAGHSRP